MDTGRLSSSQTQRSRSNSIGAILNEFLSCLVKCLWLTLLAIVKTFLPVQNKDVRNDIVLVTGAGSGIGRLMALRFAELGATLVLVDINSKGNEAVLEEIKRKKQVAHAYTCDLSDKDAIYETAAKVRQEVGSVTVLVNNAGIVSGKNIYEVSDKMVDLTMQVNAIAHMWTIKAFTPDMVSKNRGHIITIASGAGIFGIAGLVDYCASKFSALGIHQSMTMEFYKIGCTGVHTTAICPYFIDTGMFDGVQTRFPWILPILKPEYAVDKIMQAFHSNQNILLMPRVLYFFWMLLPVLPSQVQLEMASFFGLTDTMDTYTGRTKKD